MRKDGIGRFYRSLLLAGFMMTFALSAGHTASAADRIPEDNIIIDYARQTLQVITTDSEVMVAFPTVKVTEDAITSVQVKKWDIYDSEYMQEQADETKVATVDLSSINTTKGGYVAVKTDATSEAYLIHFLPVHGKLSASYDLGDGTVTVVDRANDGNECDSMFEYRTQYGSWSDYNSYDVSLRFYEQQGASLYFREKCGYDDGDTYISSGRLSGRTIADKIGIVPVAKEFVLYEALSTFSGKELKVKIPKLAEGPTATFNYAKCTMTVKQGNLYRQNSEAAFQNTPGNKAFTLTANADGGILEVRKAAKTTAKKYTPASKITHYEYPPVRKMEIKEDANGYIGNKVNKLTLVYNEATKKVDCSSTDADNTYLIWVVSPGGKAPTVGASGATTVKPPKSGTQTSVVSLSSKKFSAGSSVYVAYAADKKAMKWATEPVLLGVVK